jgi:hypothetical protein
MHFATETRLLPRQYVGTIDQDDEMAENWFLKDHKNAKFISVLSTVSALAYAPKTENSPAVFARPERRFSCRERLTHAQTGVCLGQSTEGARQQSSKRSEGTLTRCRTPPSRHRRSRRCPTRRGFWSRRSTHQLLLACHEASQCAPSPHPRCFLKNSVARPQASSAAARSCTDCRCSLTKACSAS